LSQTALCPKCEIPLYNPDSFDIAPEMREEFFREFGRPLRCPKCRIEYGVENGKAEYDTTNPHSDPFRRYYYQRQGGRTIFVGELWPTPEDMGTFFRLEDLGEQMDGTCIPFEDLRAHLAEEDMAILGEIVEPFIGCESGLSLGDISFHPEGPASETVGFELPVPELPYRELCRRIFHFYEPWSPVASNDMRLYHLIWKVTLRIYWRLLRGVRIHPLLLVSNLDFMDTVRTWAVEEYGPKIRLTPPKVRALRAVIEHFAFESMKPTEEAEMLA